MIIWQKIIQLWNANQIFMIIVINKYLLLLFIAEKIDVLILDDTHVLRYSVEGKVYLDRWLSLFVVLVLSWGVKVAIVQEKGLLIDELFEELVAI
jgi:hypothetical protein